MPLGVESIVIIVDYSNMSLFNAPPISVSKRFLDIIGNHYPERLHSAFIVHPTWYLTLFLKILRPFMDPITAAKIRIVDLKRKKAAEAEAVTDSWGYTSL
jgi:hypothetical protein